MNLVPHPLTLEGRYVTLIPLEEKHIDALFDTSRDTRIWDYLPARGDNKEEFTTAMKSAILKRMSGEEYPFVIMDKVKNTIIGCTRYLEITPEHKKLEIGWTWYDPEYWGKGHNLECKLVLLTYAFEILHCHRVQLRARDTNLRSRAAILKIGATFEGINRKAVIRIGESRNIAVYSIIDTEWDTIKQELQQKVNNLALKPD